MEDSEVDYIPLDPSEVPYQWSHDPKHFKDSGMTKDHINACLHHSVHFSHPQLLLYRDDDYIIYEVEKGYFWMNDISGYVFRISPPDWNEIVKALKGESETGLKLEQLMKVSDPPKIKYLPNPDFVDRPEFTRAFSEFPRSHVVYWGKQGTGKSQLAIQYADRIRTQSPDTWIFWVYGTNAQKLKWDLSRIWEHLLMAPYEKRRDNFEFVVEWLCKQPKRSWVMIVDDVSVWADIQPILEPILASRSGYFIITTNALPQQLPSLEPNDPVDYLEVRPFNKEKAIELFKKKLDQEEDYAPEYLEHEDSRTPLAIELRAACLNQERRRKHYLPSYEFDYLFLSLSPALKELLYFISYFDPAEVESHWISRYLREKGDETQADRLRKDIKELVDRSLLTTFDHGHIYQMHTTVQAYVVRHLRAQAEVFNSDESKFKTEIEKRVKEFGHVPTPDPSGFERFWGSKPPKYRPGPIPFTTDSPISEAVEESLSVEKGKEGEVF